MISREILNEAQAHLAGREFVILDAGPGDSIAIKRERIDLFRVGRNKTVHQEVKDREQRGSTGEGIVKPEPLLIYRTRTVDVGHSIEEAFKVHNTGEVPVITPTSSPDDLYLASEQVDQVRLLEALQRATVVNPPTYHPIYHVHPES